VPDSYLTFSRLCEKRDLAAYRVVAELRLIMDYLKAQEYDMISGVAEALDAYKAADRQIDEFRKLYQGETICSHQAWALRCAGHRQIDFACLEGRRDLDSPFRGNRPNTHRAEG